MITVVTPWLNASELCKVYAKSVVGADQVIIVDNGSMPYHQAAIRKMVNDLGGVYIRNEKNNKFSKANNQGLAVATGNVVVFMNNDVEFRGDWSVVERETPPDGIAGPSIQNKLGVDYIEGHFIAARRTVWNDLGGWPADLPGMYWEDNIVCLEAIRKGYQLIKTNWPVWHFNNYTSRNTPGAYDLRGLNQAEFVRRLEAWRAS